MGLNADLIISRENYSGSPEDLLYEMNFEMLEKTGTIDIASNDIEDDEIAIAIQNGYIFIKHRYFPTFLINGEYTQISYNHSKSRLWDNTERMISITLISSINGFGYSLYSKFSHNQREHMYLLGNYEGIAFEGEGGDIQDEEVLYKTKKPNGKIPYDGKEYEVYEIGTELTEDVLFNFYGKDIFSENIIFQKFRAKYHNLISEMPPKNNLPLTDKINIRNSSSESEKKSILKTIKRLFS